MKYNKIYVIIPARLNSTRLPNKLLLKLQGKSILQRVYEKALKLKNADSVFIAGDNRLLAEETEKFSGSYIATSENCKSGSDRIAQASEKLKLAENDIIINLQGDEPFVNIHVLDQVIDWVKHNFHFDEVYTIGKKIKSCSEIDNPNNVKVVLNKNSEALYFSRSVIPYLRDGGDFNYIKHIGVYIYSKKMLSKFALMSKSSLEKAEKLEQLRLIENGYKIKVFITEENMGIGIDTPEDMKRAEEIIELEEKI